jgi:hypothetical protein
MKLNLIPLCRLAQFRPQQVPGEIYVSKLAEIEGLVSFLM